MSHRIEHIADVSALTSSRRFYCDRIVRMGTDFFPLIALLASVRQILVAMEIQKKKKIEKLGSGWFNFFCSLHSTFAPHEEHSCIIAKYPTRIIKKTTIYLLSTFSNKQYS